eukprot:CAMPEP_0113487248 /NCGR_PEP_ID=MMETSP0014_2-20120614/25410_1 /TAXON_ID=2857 /ORGANISM="Nitzschia sp." /LENGTH=319 /DNA_ID=CAMNT_0000380937 /DNA_START=193 /DNA_END=1150 /DNA_ORIENTATION=+ /assembly_acc=CAM_ASM_000159
MSTEEATINPDGSTTYEGGSDDSNTMPPVTDESTTGGPADEGFGGTDYDETMGDDTAGETVVEGGLLNDPAIFLLVAAILLGLGYFLYRRRQAAEEDDEFFSNLDGEKFNLKLPSEVDEYYATKEKCKKAGWVPGQSPQNKATDGPHKVMAQALMKRAMADIPLVTHIQKESNGMNKLYAQSMCSVKQWRTYQAAEAMVSAEVDEVRAEADEIEPGWSQVIWRQAMQYHQMLKQKHEMEQKAAADQAAKRKAIEERVAAAKQAQQSETDKAAAAEKAAKELAEAEAREKESKKAFSDGGAVKKGFLDSGSKKKKGGKKN